jgi:hypothetical protein
VLTVGIPVLTGSDDTVHDITVSGGQFKMTNAKALLSSFLTSEEKILENIAVDSNTKTAILCINLVI